MDWNSAEAAANRPISADLLSLEQTADEFRTAWLEATRQGLPPPTSESFAARYPANLRRQLLKLLAMLQLELHRATVVPTIRGYEMVRVIADRNMAVVFQAVETETGDAVVVKVLRDAERDRAPRQEMLWRAESEVLMELRHPHIVPVKKVGNDGGFVFLVMPYITGGDLGQRVAEFALVGVPPDELRHRVRLIEQVAWAADYVHRRGVIHRDLKPSNVLIDELRQALVCDFGLARRLQDRVKLTLTGQVMGTLQYMAPEQARGERDLTFAVDIWSIGAMLYELMTGHAPFCDDNPGDHALLQRKVEPGAMPLPPSEANPAVSTDPDLEWICTRCLEHDPAKRFETARDLADALLRFQNGERVRPRPSMARRVRELVAGLSAGIKRPPAQTDYIRRWRWALRTEASTALIAHSAVLALVLSGADAPWVWAAYFLGDTACGWFVWYLYMRRARLTGMERGLMQMWTGTDLTAAFLFAVTVPLTRPPDPTAIATFYTAYLTARGLVFFIEARMCWGRLYFVSAGFYAAAAVVQLVPTYAPLIYGGAYAFWFVWMSFCKWEATPVAE